MAPFCLEETTHASPGKTSLRTVYILKEGNRLPRNSTKLHGIIFWQTELRNSSGQFPPPGVQKGATASQRDTSRTEDREDSSFLRYDSASVRNRILTFRKNKETIPSETSDVHYPMTKHSIPEQANVQMNLLYSCRFASGH
jgi:hypothetical protein